MEAIILNDPHLSNMSLGESKDQITMPQMLLRLQECTPEGYMIPLRTGYIDLLAIQGLSISCGTIQWDKCLRMESLRRTPRRPRPCRLVSETRGNCGMSGITHVRPISRNTIASRCLVCRVNVSTIFGLNVKLKCQRYALVGDRRVSVLEIHSIKRYSFRILSD